MKKKINKYRYLLFLPVLILIFSCSSSDAPSDTFEISTTPSDDNPIQKISFSIPEEDIIGPYSPFPLVTNSSFASVEEVSYPDNHLTALVSLGPNELRAYPNAFIGLYEVINNEYEDKKYALTHCPLTGSTVCWDREIDGQTMTIKASGYLFHDNIMPTDVESGSIWSQMLMRGVSGKHNFKSHGTYNVVETDWKTVKTQFPDAKVYNEIVEDAESGLNVETEPTNRDFYRYGILSGINKITVHIFNYDLFNKEGLTLISKLITGKKVLVIGNKDHNFISAYFVDNAKEYSQDTTNSFNFRDNKGNIYNAMGLIIDGPDKGFQLDSPKAYTAAWVAWQDFFENFVIVE